MLIKAPLIPEKQRDPIVAVIAQVNGNDNTITEIEPGFYLCGHFSFDSELNAAVSTYSPDLPGCLNSYGVCDSPEQFIAEYKTCLEKVEDRGYVVSFHIVRKETQPASGGWRWHKWGPYIGKKNPKCEYLHDEGPDITQACVYHIYEVFALFGDKEADAIAFAEKVKKQYPALDWCVVDLYSNIEEDKRPPAPEYAVVHPEFGFYEKEGEPTNTSVTICGRNHRCEVLYIAG